MSVSNNPHTSCVTATPGSKPRRVTSVARFRKQMVALVVLAAAALVSVAAAGAAGKQAAFKVDPSIKGQRFKMIIQGSGDPSKIVETHAIDLLKKWGADASVSYNATSSNVAIA